MRKTEQTSKQRTLDFTPNKPLVIDNVIESVNLGILQAALDLAFEAGKWEGQVELEEHYDREQYSEAIIESLYSRKNAMPMKEASSSRTVTINLRSLEWRKGVRVSAKQYVNKAMAFVIEHSR